MSTVSKNKNQPVYHHDFIQLLHANYKARSAGILVDHNQIDAANAISYVLKDAVCEATIFQPAVHLMPRIAEIVLENGIHEFLKSGRELTILACNKDEVGAWQKMLGEDGDLFKSQIKLYQVSDKFKTTPPLHRIPGIRTTFYNAFACNDINGYRIANHPKPYTEGWTCFNDSAICKKLEKHAAKGAATGRKLAL